VHQDGLTGRRPFGALREVGQARVEIAIDEVGDDLDGPLDVEFLEGLVQKILRNGGDAVALFDGKLGNRQIRTIAADQGNVRAVKRGNERKTARGGHRACEHGADGMRDGVVDMQQVQRFGFEDFKHFGGECQGVRWVVEERVGSHLDFVEENMGIVQVHADRWGVTDEMDIVTASGKLLAEFGGDDAGAAVSGVAGDAYAHGFQVFQGQNEANIPAQLVAARMAAFARAANSAIGCCIRRGLKESVT